MNDPRLVLVTSPCPSCTALWLPRATFDQHWKSATLQQLAFQNSGASTAVVMTEEGQLGPSPFYPHPDCGAAHSYFGVTGDDPIPGPLSPIKAIRYIPGQLGAPYVCQAIADAPHHLPARPFVSGAGVARNRRDAEHIATAEALERDCALRSPRALTITGYAGTRAAPGFEEIADHPFRRWVDAACVRTGRRRLVPIEFVQLGSLCTEPDPIVSADSTGMAAHRDSAAALQCGLREVAERIAIRRLWQDGVAVAWNLRTLPPMAKLLINALRTFQCEPFVLPMGRVLGYETCLALGRGCTVRNGELRPLWGAGAATTTDEAVTKALNELYGQALLARENERVETQTGHTSENVCRVLSDGATSIASYPMRPSLSIADDDEWIFAVDRGNMLTDYLGLQVVQVIVPLRYPPRDAPCIRNGMQFPFW